MVLWEGMSGEKSKSENKRLDVRSNTKIKNDEAH